VEPTFVIAGGQRCGTTSLYHLLDQHPRIFLAKPVQPEPKFFLRDPAPGRDKAWYLRQWFADTGGAAAAGEKSVSYMETPGVARRMKRWLPALRVIFVLRHPVERAISNYRFSQQHGYETESFDWAARHEAARLRETSFPQLSAHPFAYVSRSRYADYLESFLAVFSPADVLVLWFDELRDDPAGVYAQACRFLGVDPRAQAPHVEGAHNTQCYGELTIAQDTLEYLFRQFEESNRRLQELLGRDLGHWGEPTPMIEGILKR
jgi:hypothetical protein